MLMNAKFDSTCPKCQTRIHVGDPIEWERGTAATHVVCPAPVVLTPVVPAPVAHVEPAKIVKFLTAAQSHIKFPKVRFLAPDGKSELRLSLAGPTSRYKGAVQVKVDGLWVGRINPEGTVVGRDMTKELVATIERIATNPAEAAAAYGALTGRCSFCNLALTDEGSVEVGYGPICAKHYGLPHSAKGTKAVKQVGAVNPEVPAPARRFKKIVLDGTISGHESLTV